MSLNSTLLTIIVVIVLFELSVVVYAIVRHIVKMLLSPADPSPMINPR